MTEPEQTFKKIILKSGVTPNQGGYIIASDKGDMQAYADYGNLYLTAYGNIILSSATGTWVQIGTEHDPSYLQLHAPIILGQVGPQITYGHGNPTANVPDGSLYICQDATSALWIRRQGKWERVLTESYKGK